MNVYYTTLQPKKLKSCFSAEGTEGSYEVSTAVTDDVDMMCQEDYVITGFHGDYSASSDDRAWTYTCSKAGFNIKDDGADQTFSSITFSREQNFTYFCPDRAPIVGESTTSYELKIAS